MQCKYKGMLYKMMYLCIYFIYNVVDVLRSCVKVKGDAKVRTLSKWEM